MGGEGGVEKGASCPGWARDGRGQPFSFTPPQVWSRRFTSMSADQSMSPPVTTCSPSCKRKGFTIRRSLSFRLIAWQQGSNGGRQCENHRLSNRDRKKNKPQQSEPIPCAPFPTRIMIQNNFVLLVGVSAFRAQTQIAHPFARSLPRPSGDQTRPGGCFVANKAYLGEAWPQGTSCGGGHGKLPCAKALLC